MVGIVQKWKSIFGKRNRRKIILFSGIKKVWWLCPKGHSYDATIGHRTRKIHPTGCPHHYIKTFPRLELTEWKSEEGGRMWL